MNYVKNPSVPKPLFYIVVIQMHTKPHTRARTHACAYATRIHIIYTG